MKRIPQAGLSLVELMVAMAIGLITALAITQSMNLFESQKRTASMGADAQSNAAVALYYLERDTRVAGYGISNSLDLLTKCAMNGIKGYNSTRSPSEFTYSPSTFAPLVINPRKADGTLVYPAGDSNTDVVQINYSGSFGMVVDGVSIGTANGANIKLNDAADRAGFHLGDMGLVLPGAGDPTAPCVMVEITNLPNSHQCGDKQNNNGELVIVSSTNSFDNFYNDCAKTASLWNKPSSNLNSLTGITAGNYDGGKLYSLGNPQDMVSRVYAVRSRRLTSCNPLLAACEDNTKVADNTVWVPLAEDIVALRAQYGRDTTATADGQVDTWDQTTPTVATDWKRILAVRLAVASRSQQYEKTAVTTADSPALQSLFFGTLDLSHLSDWQHYRYKTIETTVPLRNVIWGQ